MKTINQYREDIKSLMKKVADIDAQAIAENRDLTSDELLLKNEMMDAVEDRSAMVKTLERQERVGNLLSEPGERETVEKKRPAMSVQIADKQKFGSIGEQMFAVMRAGQPGGSIDPRLYNAATGLGESVPSDGGFLVQQDFSSALLEQLFSTGILAARCRRQQISGNANGMKINGVDETSRAASRSGGIIGYWKDEAAEKTASKPKFRQIELNLHKLIGLCYATDELLSDAAALESFIRTAFVAEFGFQLDDAIINGNGTGKPLGILASDCVVPVAKEPAQKAKTIMAENIMKMRSRLFASSRANAVWLINQNIEPQLHSMSLAVGTGGAPIYLPANGLSGQPFDTLYGLPVLPIEQCPTLGTVGDIILADFTGGYILAEKGGIQSDMSIHVAFTSDQSVFRFVMRIDGQPVRATPLTPYKGGADYTQSHFITLATRA